MDECWYCELAWAMPGEFITRLFPLNEMWFSQPDTVNSPTPLDLSKVTSISFLTFYGSYSGWNLAEIDEIQLYPRVVSAVATPMRSSSKGEAIQITQQNGVLHVSSKEPASITLFNVQGRMIKQVSSI